jgi:hypothetical protein
VLGPEDLSFNDMAQIMSEVLRKPVRFQQIAGEAYKANLMKHGMSDAMAQGMLDMAMAKNEGLDNAEPRTPQSMHENPRRIPAQWRAWGLVRVAKQMLRYRIATRSGSDNFRRKQCSSITSISRCRTWR